jgi:uncharacterized Tic20 family protein
MNIPDELQKLQQLHASGALSAEEFATAKARLLQGYAAGPAPFPAPPAPNHAQDTRQWALFLHLSQFLGYLIPLAGFLAPILIWQLKKNDCPGLDAHGRAVVNWLISGLIYAAISGVLVLVLIGIPLLWALALAGILFPIIGAIKANSGEVWKYPLSIPFLG